MSKNDAGAGRPVWYAADQLESDEPHVIVSCVVRAGPGLGEDETPHTVDVVLSLEAYGRMRRT